MKYNTKLIDNYIDENNISKTQFAKNCKLSLKTINNLYSQTENIKILALCKIARRLDVSIKDLIVE